MGSTDGGNGSRPDRWIGVGQSKAPDAESAGREAAHGALGGRLAELLIVFCSDSYDLPRLLASITAASHDAQLIGCSTAGEIAATGPGDASVVVTAIGGDGFSIKTAIARDAASDLRGAGAAVAGSVWEVEDRCLAHSLGLQVVAEGVEDEAVLNRIWGLGCDRAQGFLIARPMPAAAVPRWIASWGGVGRPPGPAMDLGGATTALSRRSSPESSKLTPS